MSGDAKGTILVVDDSPTMRGLIRTALEGAGYRILEAADGGEGLSRLQDRMVQAILTDVNMPRMDGLAFVRAVREDTRFRHTPILVLTTEAEPAMKAAGKGAGATGWIVKPFQAEQLCGVVDLVIRRMTQPPGAPADQAGCGVREGS
jgi:two-component system, chemotaxis family, chemotaxis protein CheY